MNKLKIQIPIFMILMSSTLNIAIAQDNDADDQSLKYQYPVEYHAPVFFTFGLGLPNGLTISFPNIHVGAGLKYFSKNPGLTKMNSTKGLYASLYWGGSDKKPAFGIRSIYLLKPLEARLNFYPLFQLGKNPAKADPPSVVNGRKAYTELRIGVGAMYTIISNIGVYAELGTGFTPLFIGVTWRGNFHKYYSN